MECLVVSQVCASVQGNAQTFQEYRIFLDDFYVVSADKEWLRSLVTKIETFLSSQLGLTLHAGKLKILDV